MTRYVGILAFLLTLCVSANDGIFHPATDRHRSAAVDLFLPSEDGSLGSLQETYEALRAFQILGIEPSSDIKGASCHASSTSLNPSSKTDELFYALKITTFLHCDVDSALLEGVSRQLESFLKAGRSLSDYYYSIESLVSIKEQGHETSSILSDASGVFRSIKSLSQTNGRWRYNSSGAESSIHAAGMAFSALAGVVTLASSNLDQSLIDNVKSDILKLFGSLESYDDGALYFDEKFADASYNPLATSASIVRGVAAFAAATSGGLNIPGDKILGLANFFLSVGIPATAHDLYLQLDSLAILENNRISVPLILSIPVSVLSLTTKDPLKVKVTTVLGSEAPPLTVTLAKAQNHGLKDAPVIVNKEMKFDPEMSVHTLDFLSSGIDVGKYGLSFEILFNNPEHGNAYFIGGKTHVMIYVTGSIKIDGAEMKVFDNDDGRVENAKRLDFSIKDAVGLSANHLQKLRLFFKLTTPIGKMFKPHQLFLKLRHETKFEHIFVIGVSQNQFEITLDFLGLVEKFFYLSGKYDLELSVGDPVMENSFLQHVGHLNLDLPDPPEKGTRPPPQPVNVHLRFGPKPEIEHIFRAPERRPRRELSLAFLGFTLVPFIGFLIGLLRLSVNLKNFPSSTLPATFAIFFHVGIAAILLLYVLFWVKLDLFTTLKGLGLLGIFLLFVGHKTLSHVASVSTKLKSA